MSNLPVIAAATMFTLAAPCIHADPAVVIHPGTGTCGVLDANLNFVLTSDAQIVSTQSQDNHIMVRCRAKGVPNDTGSAIIFEYHNTGFLCVMIDPILGARTTRDSQETLTPSGVATAVCLDSL